jgi:hypothetical protein
VTELGAALRDPTHGTEALGILRGLIDKVTLTLADDHFAIELRGRWQGCWRWRRVATLPSMEANARHVLDAAWAAGIRYFDAAPTASARTFSVAGWKSARSRPRPSPLA